MPWFKKCKHPDCIGTSGNPSCKVTILEIRGPELWMIPPHRKIMRKCGGVAIQFQVPELLKQVLRLHVARGYKVLSPDSIYVISDAMGRPMKQQPS